MGKTRAYLFVLWLSFKCIFIVKLGDKVYYKGKIATVMNGVVLGKWNLKFQNEDYNSDKFFSREDCKKVKSFSNLFGSFVSGYKFYMGYWFDIWKREGIKDWMLNCNIW